MKKKLILIVSIFLMNACSLQDGLLTSLEQSPANWQEIALMTSQSQLRQSALSRFKQNKIRHADSAAGVVALTESTDISINSIDATGAIASYKISYTLIYTIDEQKKETFSRSRILSHNENNFHASELQREKVLNDLRQSALEKVIYQIHHYF